MILGFSGPDRPMSVKQYLALQILFQRHLEVLHHGDCVGCDDQAHAIAISLGKKVEIHPPINPHARAWCQGPNVKIHQPKPYLKRNWDIAKSCEFLVATPPGPEVIRGVGGGTWSTIRYARKLRRPRWIINLDGTITVEG